MQPMIMCIDVDERGVERGYWSNAIPGVTGPPDLDIQAALRLEAKGWRVLITPDPDDEA